MNYHSALSKNPSACSNVIVKCSFNLMENTMHKTPARLLATALLIALSLALAPAISAEAPRQSAACEGVNLAPERGQRDESFDFDGATRSYRLYVPSTLDPEAPAPLVLSLHGFTSNPGQQQFFSKWDEIAETENFIVVYPQGTGAPLRWNAGIRLFNRADQTDDVGFIRALIARLSGEFCIDPARVFVNGLSNGAGMSHRLACDLSDVIAAAGGVAGAYPGANDACETGRPVPIIAFHGTEDPIVPYDGNLALPGIEGWAAAWAARNGCNGSTEAIPAVGDVRGLRYLNCQDDAEVVLYTVEGGGHTWPGGGVIPEFLVGKTNQDVSASALMWEFFKAHPLAAAAAG